MRLFYNKDLSENDTRVIIEREESRHIVKVLRKKIGDKIYITNGKGILFTTEIDLINKNSTELKIINNQKHNESKFSINIAVAPTKMNDRMEWFVEKSTEIGINTITSVLCEKSERKKIKVERLEKIAISAMKQSLQFYKPNIDNLIAFDEFVKTCKSNNKFIAHCKDNNKLYLRDCELNLKTVTVLIGPEGGFSDIEIDLAEDNGFKSISLGNTRLRTETAAIVATQLLSVFNANI
ncbi:16S rRNA (uracil(1498)-N(3))-methyltransferase [Flavobacteriaceae bacterium]|jgi:16S rRNA (uracil1498-N3)-methyltransferase|nr:16S rRNA (uracil(1498)-N(3))-methyltransferase [Flavobacteriaceae bacterium]